MADLNIRRQGRAGRITLTRPSALNALTHAMMRAIHDALDQWRDDDDIALIIIDAQGDRAFCAGGDLTDMYQASQTGDHAASQRFFADEYRMDAAISVYPKPVVVFAQGFVMGGGIGLAGHASHRIVGDSTQIAIPETGIGLIPDAGCTWILSRAPGQIGEYLALTGARFGAGDAIHAGFADYFIPESDWPGLMDKLAQSGDIGVIPDHTPPKAFLANADLSAFAAADIDAIAAELTAQGDDAALNLLHRGSPLSLAATLALVRAARDDDTIYHSLAREYRFTYRATKDSDFAEGIRAQIIDKDRNPIWTADASAQNVAAMLAPLGPSELHWKEHT